jgi:hypothetical protein
MATVKSLKPQGSQEASFFGEKLDPHRITIQAPSQAPQAVSSYATELARIRAQSNVQLRVPDAGARACTDGTATAPGL